MKDNSRWVWTLIQGLVAVGLGLWVLVGRDSALTVLSYAVAIYLTIAGLIQTIQAVMRWGHRDTMTRFIYGLIGLIGGGLVLIMAYFLNSPLATIFAVLAVVLILYGAVGLFASLFARGNRRFRFGPILINLLLLVLGVLVFADRTQPVDVVMWAGVILVVIGILYILYAFTAQRGKEEEPQVASAEAAKPPAMTTAEPAAIETGVAEDAD